MNFLSLFKRSLIYKLKKKDNIDLDGIENSSLDKLFSHYGTDKSEYSKDKKNKNHGFSKYYEKNLSFLKIRIFLLFPFCSSLNNSLGLASQRSDALTMPRCGATWCMRQMTVGPTVATSVPGVL